MICSLYTHSRLGGGVMDDSHSNGLGWLPSIGSNLLGNLLGTNLLHKNYLISFSSFFVKFSMLCINDRTGFHAVVFAVEILLKTKVILSLIDLKSWTLNSNNFFLKLQLPKIPSHYPLVRRAFSQIAANWPVALGSNQPGSPDNFSD